MAGIHPNVQKLIDGAKAEVVQELLAAKKEIETLKKENEELKNKQTAEKVEVAPAEESKPTPKPESKPAKANNKK